MPVIKKETALDIFLRTLSAVGKRWASMNGYTDAQKIDGVIFSLLNILDGGSVGLPAIDLVLRPNPEDKQYHIDNGNYYFEDGMAINDDAVMHERWNKY